MPDAHGNIKGIAVPNVPWHRIADSREFRHLLDVLKPVLEEAHRCAIECPHPELGERIASFKAALEEFCA